MVPPCNRAINNNNMQCFVIMGCMFHLVLFMCSPRPGWWSMVVPACFLAVLLCALFCGVVCRVPREKKQIAVEREQTAAASHNPSDHDVRRHATADHGTPSGPGPRLKSMCQCHYCREQKPYGSRPSQSPPRHGGARGDPRA